MLGDSIYKTSEPGTALVLAVRMVIILGGLWVGLMFWLPPTQLVYSVSYIACVLFLLCSLLGCPLGGQHASQGRTVVSLSKGKELRLEPNSWRFGRRRETSSAPLHSSFPDV